MTPHTTSLKLSKQLKELGWKRETLFVWVKSDDTPKPHLVSLDDVYDWNYQERYSDAVETNNAEIVASAPTASEILAVMPDGTRVTKEGKIYISLNYTMEETPAFNYIMEETPAFKGNTPANALSLILIYLAENKLIDLGEVG